MARLPRTRIDKEPAHFARSAIPIVSTMIGSLAPIAPFVFLAPVVPPFGLMMLLAWRALHRTLWPTWMALPLGFFDDLFSGAPMGSAMLLWTLAFLVYELFDRRMVWRDYWQEWGIAVFLICAVILGQLWIANRSGGATDVFVMIPQAVFSALLFPLMTRICCALDNWRLTL